MRQRLVAGIDSSTQQTKLVVVDLHAGELVRSSALPHPDGTELDPEHWWAALHGTGGADPAGVEALSVTAQQHTTIVLDAEGIIRWSYVSPMGVNPGADGILAALDALNPNPKETAR